MSNLISIHLAVILFGLAGLIGKLVSVEPLIIVFSRTTLAFIVLFIILKFQSIKLSLNSWKNYLYFLLIGFILAIHWLSFFMAIKTANVAIGLLGFASYPLFVTFLEPVFFQQKVKKADIFIAILITAGLLIVSPAFDLQNNIFLGLILGIISALTFSALSILIKLKANIYTSMQIAFYQNFFAAIFLLPIMLFAHSSLEISKEDIAYLLFLGIFCTAIAHTLYVVSLSKLKAFTVSAITSLEAVYGILFAYLFLSEIPEIRQLLGGLLIIFSSIISQLRIEKQG